MLEAMVSARQLRFVRTVALVSALVLGFFLPHQGSAETREISSRMMNDYARRYLRSPKTPTPSDTVFWVVAYPRDSGIRYLTANSDSGAAMLLFTSPFQSWAYAEGAPDVPHPWAGIGWTPAMAVDRLRSIHDESGVQWFVLDKSPGCERFTILPLEPPVASVDLSGLWTVWRNVAIDVGNRHFRDAVSAARMGDFEAAWEIDWQLLNCVIPEEPGLHVLAGACGVALANERVVHTATMSLVWLDPPIADTLSREAASAHGKSAVERRKIALRIVQMVDSVQTPLLKR